MRSSVITLAVLGFAFSIAAQDATITIDQILSAPFPSEMVASPVDGKVAWVFNEQGARNIWVAEGPDYVGRRLTAYTEDDGQELGSLLWTGDGLTLVYVRGGSPNGKGEFPNPTSGASGASQAIWRIDLSGGEARHVATGSGPTIAPDGRGIAYLNRNQIWTMSLRGRTKPKLLFKGRGTLSNLRSSPDGNRVAFVSGRGDTSFVGVVEVTTQRVTWMGPSVDRDRSPVWSPDGLHVAFVRHPTPAPDFAFEPRRVGEPWSIHVADVATGASREVWRAAEGVGSVWRGVEAKDQLLWCADDNLVFPWEPEGWTHLYSVSASGGNARLLTPGAFEVEHVGKSLDGESIYYSSNQDDIERRHLWRVGVAAGDVLAVTSGDGIEWTPAPLSDGRGVAYLRSDAALPARPAIMLDGGSPRDLARDALPEDFPADRMVQPIAVEFAAEDGVVVRGQLFMPKEIRGDGQHPAAIFMHGGSRRQMLLGWHYGDYYHNAYGMNQYLAAKGYVVLALNYRSGTGYGMEFREALNYGATGASEFQDVLAAGKYLQERPEVDRDRIGLWGGSYGGFLTAMGLSRASDMFAVGVDIHGVHNWNVVIKNFVPSYDTLRNPERARIALESSPISYVSTWRSPVMLIHGDDDRNVPFSESTTLVEALRKYDVLFEQLVFPDEVHGFLLHSNWKKAFAATSDFLHRHLRNR